MAQDVRARRRGVDEREHVFHRVELVVAWAAVARPKGALHAMARASMVGPVVHVEGGAFDASCELFEEFQRIPNFQVPEVVVDLALRGLRPEGRAVVPLEDADDVRAYDPTRFSFEELTSQIRLLNQPTLATLRANLVDLETC